MSSRFLYRTLTSCVSETSGVANPLKKQPMAVDTNLFPPRYRGAQQVARGGMGEIYRATDSVLGRAVAIKVLAERYAQDDAVRDRFTREAMAAARLSGQRNTVTIYDVGEHGGRPYIVMEYLGGGSLEDVLRDEGAQPPQRAFTWLEQAGAALDAAHAEGVVHRDVKPANLMLDRAGNVHVADFGIASAAGMDSLTVTGTVLGTAGYLSPEQAMGDRATAASDRYGLAVVAYELLTGKRPFQADSPTAEASAHVNAPVPSVCDLSNLPCELDPVFRKALAKEPGERYESCADFVAALRAAFAEAAGPTRELRAVAPAPPPPVYERRSRARSPWPLLLLLLAAGVAGGALAAYFLTRDDGSNKPAAAPPQPKVTTVLHTVTKPTGQTTTVVQQVTTTPPATSSPPPAGGGGSGGVGGHALNDAGYKKMQGGDYAGAVPLLQQAVRALDGTGPRDPYEAYANYNLGYSLLKLDRCNEAIPYLQEADRLEPWRHEPRDALARAQACA
jgi:tRNA A-37 threonylcarbamoyl transferase component Bud32